MKQFFAYTVEAILRVLDSDPSGMSVYDIVQFLWGGVCVFLLILLFGFVYHKAAVCMKRFVVKIKKRST